MDRLDPLRDVVASPGGRTLEGTVRQMATVLVWMAECNLATLEDMQERKSTPKGELKRQREICERVIGQCVDLGFHPGVRGLRGFACPRLDEALKRAAAGLPVLGEQGEQKGNTDEGK